MSLSDKHIFFDLDRTLWDFDLNSKNALLQIFEELDLIDIFRTFDRFYNAYVAQNARLWKLYGEGKLSKDVLRYERFNATLMQFNIDNIDLAKEMGSMYVSISPFQKKLFPGTIACLDELRSIGFHLHIITNGFEEVQYIKLQNCGLDGFFDVIVCSEAVGQNNSESAAKPVHTSKFSFDFLPHSTLHWRGTGAWYHLVSLWRSVVVLSKLVLLLSATRDSRYYLALVRLSSGTKSQQNATATIAHAQQCSMCHARTKSAHAISHFQLANAFAA